MLRIDWDYIKGKMLRLWRWMWSGELWQAKDPLATEYNENTESFLSGVPWMFTQRLGGVTPTLRGLDSAAGFLSGLYHGGTAIPQYPFVTILTVSMLDPTYRMVSP